MCACVCVCRCDSERPRSDFGKAGEIWVLGSPWGREDRAGPAPCVGKERDLSWFLCSSNQFAHILGICALGTTCWSQACLGLRGRGAYVRPWGHRALGGEGGLDSACYAHVEGPPCT